MPLRRAGAATASVALLAVAGLHAAWGAGSAWPLPDRAALADAVIGAADVPGPAACFAVSGALAAAGVLVAGWPAMWPRARRLGSGTVVAVLAARGALGLAGRTQLVSPASTSATFVRLDRRVYSPLCLAMADRPPEGLAVIVTRTGERESRCGHSAAVPRRRRHRRGLCTRR